VLRLVGAAVPDLDMVAAGEVEEGGEEDGVEGSTALVELVELPGAAVAVEGEEEDGGGVGVAPVYAADDVGPDGIGRRLTEVAIRAAVEGVDEALEGDEETLDLLVGEGASVAKRGDEVGWEVGKVGASGGAEEGVVGPRSALEVAPIAVTAMRSAGVAQPAVGKPGWRRRPLRISQAW